MASECGNRSPTKRKSDANPQSDDESTGINWRVDSESCTNREEDEAVLERRHFFRIVNAFRFYRIHSLQRVRKSDQYLKSLSKRHQHLLGKFQLHLDKVRLCVEHNYRVINEIIRDVAHLFDNADHVRSSVDDVTVTQGRPSNVDMEKVQSTLKQFVRDWSCNGSAERDSCYRPIIDELCRRYPRGDRGKVSVVVPGAGLGRLAFEIAKSGFVCQGNEFSLFMLFASNFVLNRCQGINLFTLYPWIHQFCNNFSSLDQLESISFPDVDPSNLPQDSQFSMAAGDFLEVYTEPDSWDSVVTCFFLDTANNIVAYIDKIWFILKPGGYWINFGPLLYHFADLPNENSIEPGYDIVREIICRVGFVFLKEETNVKCTYSHNPRSMLKYEYNSVFFVCQKSKSCQDQDRYTCTNNK